MAIKHIYGTVGLNGNVISGEDFKVHRLQKGTYIVEFEEPFSAKPTSVCTIFGPPWKTFNLSITIVEILESHFICVTSTPDRLLDCDFTFIAIGKA